MTSHYQISQIDAQILEEVKRMYRDMPLLELLEEENLVQRLYVERRIDLARVLMWNALRVEIERKLR